MGTLSVPTLRDFGAGKNGTPAISLADRNPDTAHLTQLLLFAYIPCRLLTHKGSESLYILVTHVHGELGNCKHQVTGLGDLFVLRPQPEQWVPS